MSGTVKLNRRRAIRTAAIAFPVSIALMTASEFAGIFPQRGWMEILGYSLLWSILFALFINLGTAKPE